MRLRPIFHVCYWSYKNSQEVQAKSKHHSLVSKAIFKEMMENVFGFHGQEGSFKSQSLCKFPVNFSAGFQWWARWIFPVIESVITADSSWINKCALPCVATFERKKVVFPKFQWASHKLNYFATYIFLCFWILLSLEEFIKLKLKYGLPQWLKVKFFTQR